MFVITPSSLHPLILSLFSSSPALCQRMSSTSINLSSSLAIILMIHNWACIFVSTPIPPSTPTHIHIFLFCPMFLSLSPSFPLLSCFSPPSSISQAGAELMGIEGLKIAVLCLARWGELWTQEHHQHLSSLVSLCFRLTSSFCCETPKKPFSLLLPNCLAPHWFFQKFLSLYSCGCKWPNLMRPHVETLNMDQIYVRVSHGSTHPEMTADKMAMM